MPDPTLFLIADVMSQMKIHDHQLGSISELIEHLESRVRDVSLVEEEIKERIELVQLNKKRRFDFGQEK